MYAIVEVGAKQYRIKKDDVIEVEKMVDEKGKDIILDRVLLASKDKKVEIGFPYLKDVKVTATVVKDIKGEKVISFKYRRRKASHTTKGHRQNFTVLKIKDIKISE